MPWQGQPIEPLYVFGAAGRASDNRALEASPFRDSTSQRSTSEKNPRKRGTISVRALDRWAMICVRLQVPRITATTPTTAKTNKAIQAAPTTIAKATRLILL